MTCSSNYSVKGWQTLRKRPVNSSLPWTMTHALECSCFMIFIKQVEENSKPRILSLFRSMFYKFNHTGARILDSNYHMTLNLV